MRLRDLEPYFIYRETRPCEGQGDCITVSPHTEHEYLIHTDAIADADGIWFLCPVCFQKNSGPIGTHAIICWRPRVPPEVFPRPGRWEFEGTGIDDLTLVAGSSSILLTDRKSVV